MEQYRVRASWGTEMRQKIKCEARTRSGGSCQMKVVTGKKRCRLHGGLSTGPKTTEGKKRSLEALAKARMA